ncbi:MAG TPA: phosphate ABC transporter substrate-binding protein [Herpetosiphonaceae bacterium]
MRRNCFALILFALLAACGAPGAAAPPPAASPAPPLKGRITFAGSTTVQPLVDKLGAAFRERHPQVSLEVAAGGTAVGITAIKDGTVDIGMASRELLAGEGDHLTRHHIASDVLAVVVHPSNPVANLSLAQLRDIYQGRVDSWRALGGPDLPIVPVVRERSSGTRLAFEELALGKQEPIGARLQTAVTAGDAAAIVRADPRAIAYVGFGNLDGSLKPLAIDGAAPELELVRAGRYRLVRPLLLLSGPLSQPLAGEFINFVLSPEGQRLVGEDGWVPAR